MKKTWNIPEMTELTIKATAGGGERPLVEDGCNYANVPNLGAENCS